MRSIAINKSDGRRKAPALLPFPKKFISGRGAFNHRAPVRFNARPDINLTEATIRLALNDALPLADHPESAPPDAGLALIIGNPDIPDPSDEAYSLEIKATQIRVVGRAAQGVIMGLRTLAQLALSGRIPHCRILDWPDMAIRGAHVCYHCVRETLANNSPNFEALLRQIDTLAAAKINCILLELESLFPFRKHPLVSCALAFTPEQIQALRHRLETHHMEIIPLVKCLGHAYNVLCHDAYADYREAPNTCQQFCPTNPAVADLYIDFVEEYLAAFPGIRRWHMGADECRQMGVCPRCKAKLASQGAWRLYADHVNAVADRLHTRGLTPMIWSDMWEKNRPTDSVNLPEYVQIVYWNYDLDNWPQPYALPIIMKSGHHVIGAPAVRFGAQGTELSVYYPIALRNIGNFIPALFREGCREVITTNWMKGSPHETTEYGLLYAADVSWNTSAQRDDFQKRFAPIYFGIGNREICDVYELLSKRLPYAEPVQHHLVDALNRFDLSGFRFPDKWKKYSSGDSVENEVINFCRQALESAVKAQAIIDRFRPQCVRRKWEFEILALSARCMIAKARFAQALQEGRRYEAHPPDNESLLRWCADYEAVIGDWLWCKERHRMMLRESGFPPAIDFLNELMFEPLEIEFFSAMGRRIAAKIAPGQGPSDVAVAFFDNPGAPYDRGFRHGSVFRGNIARIMQKYRLNIAGLNNQTRAVLDRMIAYVSERWPDIIAEMKGIAAGAEKNFEEIFWLNAFNAVPHCSPSSCSTVILKDADGSLHLAKTSDIDPVKRTCLLIRRVRQAGLDFYVLGWYGTLWVEIALTRAGLAVGMNSGPIQPNQTGDGCPQHLGLYPVLLSKVKKTNAAIKILSGFNFAGKGLVIGIADADGKAALIEKTGTGQGVRRLSGNCIYGCNLFYSEKMKTYNLTRGVDYRKNSAERVKRIERWLASASARPAIEALKELIGDAKSAGALCQTGQNNFFTESAALLSPAERRVRLTGLPPSQQQFVSYQTGISKGHCSWKGS